MTECKEREESVTGEERPSGDTAGFLILETILYAAFLTGDWLALGRICLILKYLSILLCLGFAFRRFRSTGEWIVAAALALTCAADALLLPGQYVALGICLFLAVQTLYAIRIGKDTAGTVGIRLLSAAGFCLMLHRLDLLTPQNLLAGLYFPQLVCNAVLAWCLETRWGRLFAVGLTLFIGCDICVGLWNLEGVPPLLERAAGLGMWMFYLPSQVCIALTAGKMKQSKGNAVDGSAKTR